MYFIIGIAARSFWPQRNHRVSVCLCDTRFCAPFSIVHLYPHRYVVRIMNRMEVRIPCGYESTEHSPISIHIIRTKSLCAKLWIFFPSRSPNKFNPQPKNKNAISLIAMAGWSSLGNWHSAWVCCWNFLHLKLALIFVLEHYSFDFPSIKRYNRSRRHRTAHVNLILKTQKNV